MSPGMSDGEIQKSMPKAWQAWNEVQREKKPT